MSATEMKIHPLEEGEKLPLCIEPGSDDRPGALVEWIAGNRPFIEEKLPEHGALLLRGFAIERPEDFEQVALAISPDLKNDYLGTSPRDAVTKYVFNASELPGYYPIPQHCEMTFVANPPRRLFFCCLVAPEGPGGETPLCDFRKVYKEMDQDVLRRFIERGVRLIRNYSGPEGGSRLDPWRLKRWDEMFCTTDRSVVEQRCRENGFEWTWKEGGQLRLLSHHKAIAHHPTTREPLWFNHAQVFHLGSAPAEYRRIVARTGQGRDRFFYYFASLMVYLKRRLTAPEDQSMHVTYDDGSEIPERDMEAVRDAIWSNMVFFRWCKGDVVAIDNYAVAHGRMPYRGPRRVVVCWA